MAKGKENQVHIGIFGKRNAGKSSFINAMTGQDLAIVSDTPGTTTDPVKKSIELPGIGACVMIDTAGIDDTGSLGKLRIEKTMNVIDEIDIAILIVTGNSFDEFEEKIVSLFKEKAVPYFLIHNKSDLVPLGKEFLTTVTQSLKTEIVDFSSFHPDNKDAIVAVLRKYTSDKRLDKPSLIGDLIKYGDIVLLITPIDIEAPEGRLILPQVQAIRDILDNDAIAIVLKEREVDAFFRKTDMKPALAICDSSIFLKAAASVPEDIPLTGFSIILARYKGDFENYLKGTPKISELKSGDRILILESCTHHVSCDDIGRVKIPRWLSNFTGKNLEFEVVTGLNKLPRDIRDYALVVQCGGCVITRRQLINRLKPAIDAGIPVTNYGMVIAYVQGVYDRAIQPFVSGKFSGEDYL